MLTSQAAVWDGEKREDISDMLLIVRAGGGSWPSVEPWEPIVR